LPTWERGECPLPTPTPEPTATPTPEPTPTPELMIVCFDNGEDEPFEREVPKTREAWARVLYSYPDSYLGECDVPEPTVTPEPEPEGWSPSPFVQGTEPPTCTEKTPEPAVNFHVYRNGDMAVLKWWNTEGNKVNIYWKENSSSEWQHSLIGVDNTGYREIGGLGNADITFGVEQLNDCMPSPLVSFQQVVIDAVSSVWVLWR